MYRQPIRIVAEGREETEPCERGTVGCCIDHTAEMKDREGFRDPARRDSSCETW